MQLSNFLRTVLKLDAATCVGTGALVLATVGSIAAPLGIGTGLLTTAGALLIPIGLYMLWLGLRREAAPGLVWLVIVGNIGWAAASLLVAGALPGITPIGQALVSGQGLAVFGLAVAEWFGLRQSQAAIA